MKIFYVDALMSAELQDYPLIAACYPQRILLRAKTKKGAVNEAWRIQQKQDDEAWDLIKQLQLEGRDWKRAYGLGPCYPNWVYCFDTETGERCHVA